MPVAFPERHWPTLHRTKRKDRLAKPARWRSALCRWPLATPSTRKAMFRARPNLPTLEQDLRRIEACGVNAALSGLKDHLVLNGPANVLF
jgi:hypothetical protein